MKDIVIAAFYKFISLDDFEDLREIFLKKMHELNIKGTIILAHEGINGTFAGEREPMDKFYQFMCKDKRLADLKFNETFDKENPFDKAKVKLRDEVVTLKVDTVDPKEEVGEYLTPEQWNQLIKDQEVVLIDTRNDYEYHLGTFENAINPKTRNFRDFPEYVEKNLLDKKNKKIAMFCTGGIRCEKSTSYLKKLGFKDVYHLKGGILNYLEEMKDKKDSLWNGHCFVFDERVAIDHSLKRVSPQLPQDTRHSFDS